MIIHWYIIMLVIFFYLIILFIFIMDLLVIFFLCENYNCFISFILIFLYFLREIVYNGFYLFYFESNKSWYLIIIDLRQFITKIDVLINFLLIMNYYLYQCILYIFLCLLYLMIVVNLHRFYLNNLFWK